MANVNITFVGRTTLASSAAFPVAYNTYRQIAIDNGLTIPDNGFAIESWSPAEPRFPLNVIFQWKKAGQNQNTLEEQYTAFQALAQTHSFVILNMNAEPA